MNQAWSHLLNRIMTMGEEVSPRGKLTKELRQETLMVDMRRPVLTDPRRKLSYIGLAAEAYWILSGSDQLADLVPYLPRYQQFSDDGVTLNGAYGPRVAAQLGYVVEKLRSDPDTRQATLTLWERNPLPSKDIPCTVVMDFKLRSGKLNLHVFMRSSDAWLGIPYDVFSFAMVAHLVCCRLNFPPPINGYVEPGMLYLTAASSHLYEENWLMALRCAGPEHDVSQYPTPETTWTNARQLMVRLGELRQSAKGDRLRWWGSGQ